MRLLKPSPGECADRQTILWLKIQYGSGGQEASTRIDMKREEGKARVVIENPSPINIQPFLEENEFIQRHLEANWFPDIANDPEKQRKWDSVVEELAELNHQIWKLTDQSHVLKDAPDRMQAQANARAAEVLFAITDLNDKRANLVRDLNELFEIRTVEKIFA